MRDFRELNVWEKSHRLTLDVYGATAEFPREELYGLTSQIRRASASIPANIAEGCGRSGVPELVRFLNISMGSASELEYHLLLACYLGFFKPDVYGQLANQASEVKRMLGAYIHRIDEELDARKIVKRNQIREDSPLDYLASDF